ncbi:MAG: transposase, partial [Candidatus Hermodarchaeota archaeon]
MGRSSWIFAIEKQRDKDVLEPSSPTDAIGVDVGMNFIAVTSDTANKTLFYGGGGMKYTRWKYFMLRQGLQSKGTRSAKRKLHRMSGRERRFVTDNNHCMAKKIVQDAKTRFQNPVIVLEDLTNI